MQVICLPSSNGKHLLDSLNLVMNEKLGSLKGQEQTSGLVNKNLTNNKK